MFKAVSARTAARVCGYESVAMLDYLERSEVFVLRQRKRGRGRKRLYDFRDLIVLKTIRKLLESGASVAALKHALQEFQTERWSADEAVLECSDGPLRYVILSNGRFVMVTSSNQLYDLSCNSQMIFGFMIDMNSLHTELCDKLFQRELPL